MVSPADRGGDRGPAVLHVTSRTAGKWRSSVRLQQQTPVQPSTALGLSRELGWTGAWERWLVPRPTPREPLPGGLGGIWESASVTSARDSPRTTLHEALAHLAHFSDPGQYPESETEADSSSYGASDSRTLGGTLQLVPSCAMLMCSTAGRCQRL